jgi:hypothetical protein
MTEPLLHYFIRLSIMTDMNMRRPEKGAALVAALIVSTVSGKLAAAEVEMPPRMPKAALFQDVGLTRIAVEYRSAAVRGRSIWGAQVPFDAPWRSGDSPQATIAFSRDVTIGGKTVPAGAYALVATPSPTAWTFALRKTGGGEDAEIARVQAVSKAIDPRERLRFVFSSFTTSTARLDLEWARVRVSLPIDVDTDGQILSAIAALDRRESTLGREYAEAGHYLLSKKNDATDHAKGLAYLQRASALGDARQDPTFRTLEPKLVEGPGVAPALVPSPSERAAPEPARTRTATRAPGADEIGPVVKQGRPAIEACYQRALRRDPSLGRGRLTVSISIGTLGLVKSVVVQAPDGLRPVEACVKSAVTRWVFPPSPEAYSAELPLVLDGHD